MTVELLVNGKTITYVDSDIESNEEKIMLLNNTISVINAQIDLLRTSKSIDDLLTDRQLAIESGNIVLINSLHSLYLSRLTHKK